MAVGLAEAESDPALVWSGGIYLTKTALWDRRIAQFFVFSHVHEVQG